MWLSSDWAEECEQLGAKNARLGVKALQLLEALNDALDAIDFAHAEGFEWPTDPYTPAILKIYPKIKPAAPEPTENTPGTSGQP